MTTTKLSCGQCVSLNEPADKGICSGCQRVTLNTVDPDQYRERIEHCWTCLYRHCPVDNTGCQSCRRRTHNPVDTDNFKYAVAEEAFKVADAYWGIFKPN